MKTMATSVFLWPLQQASCICGAGSSTGRKGSLTDKVVFRTPGRLNVQCAQRRDNPGDRCVSAIGRGSRDEATVAGSQWNRVACQSMLKTALAASVSLALYFGTGVEVAQARFEGVNKPELLPEKFSPVIDVAGFLSSGQEARIVEEVNKIEEETGFKLRVLAQNYPNTPGLAIRDFWKVDDTTIVFVADPSLGNILNFNVGASVDLSVPRSFWNRLAGKYGNIFYWREKGEDVSIEAAVTAIGACLREPPGAFTCSEIQ